MQPAPLPGVFGFSPADAALITALVAFVGIPVSAYLSALFGVRSAAPKARNEYALKRRMEWLMDAHAELNKVRDILRLRLEALVEVDAGERKYDDCGDTSEATHAALRSVRTLRLHAELYATKKMGRVLHSLTWEPPDDLIEELREENASEVFQEIAEFLHYDDVLDDITTEIAVLIRKEVGWGRPYSRSWTARFDNYVDRSSKRNYERAVAMRRSYLQSIKSGEVRQGSREDKLMQFRLRVFIMAFDERQHKRYLRDSDRPE